VAVGGFTPLTSSTSEQARNLMTDTERTDRLMHELRAKRAAASSRHNAFLSVIEDSDDADAILEAARGSVAARSEVDAIELATRELANVAASEKLGGEMRTGAGSAGRNEAARRFAKRSGASK
jgi:uncharacterized protein YhaN